VFEKSLSNLNVLEAIDAPSKQGYTLSPKIHNFENIASFIIKNSILLFEFFAQ
jgi:hypothetical protein